MRKPNERWGRPGKLWKQHFLAIEFLLSLLSATAFWIWMQHFGGLSIVADLLKSNRAAVYGTLATIFGSLLGFVITAMSVVMGLVSSAQLKIVTGSKHYKQLWDVFTSTTKALGLATIIALAGLIFDRDSAPRWSILEVCVFAFVLCVVRLARCLWVLEMIVRILTSEPEPLRASPGD
jgi:hypothetical protein